MTRQNPPRRQKACFTTGSIMRHVIVMAGTGAIGLMAVFAVDMLNMVYIAHLNKPALTAAIGFAGAVIGLQIAVAIGLTIGLSAATAREIGAGRHEEARHIATSALVVTLLITLLLGLCTSFAAHPILSLFGAHGEALEQATSYLHVVSPFLPLICIGMGASSLMRVVGDAKGSMNITLLGAIVAAVLDPLMIFGLHEGLTGAAISSVLSRLVVAGIGLRGALRHDMLARPDFSRILPDARRVGSVAMPAILTNLATPVAGAYVTGAMSRFGLEAVGGQASIERMVPVLFSLVFALTGSVGPIMAQNLGAGRCDRVHETLTAALKLVMLSVGATWVILAALQDYVVAAFHAQGNAALLIHLFCSWTIGAFLFVGMLFVANAAFNNLGFPLYSTAFNWGRATLGTIPFVWFGSRFGPAGVQFGYAAGGIVFGSLAVMTAFRVTRALTSPDAAHIPAAPGEVPVSDVPTVSAEAAMAELDELGGAPDIYDADRSGTHVKTDH
ncbi:MATE family efflux transporter [Acetobacter farinalis]|uniref:MATE family efflux transporter n=1 Tax=Acetobacter farinalis TaxID=1260984 RepID=A0ABT3Q9P9_9PROT|nr:MATE family efflux transporter [Acetobacter farinalis]MCX2562013.1 MATE family efflux transporter [Acetobacter farinalis]NHO30603.1 multidrug transporter [Acetobacter farinalis]